MQVLLFLHRLYFFVILNIRNKKTYKMKKIIFLFIISSLISIKRNRINTLSGDRSQYP